MICMLQSEADFSDNFSKDANYCDFIVRHFVCRETVLPGHVVRRRGGRERKNGSKVTQRQSFWLKSAPIGALQVKLDALTGNYDRPTECRTNGPNNSHFQKPVYVISFQEFRSICKNLNEDQVLGNMNIF